MTKFEILRNTLAGWRRDLTAATAVEYGLIAALIAVAAITAMKGTGSQLKSTFNTTSSAMAASNA